MKKRDFLQKGFKKGQEFLLIAAGIGVGRSIFAEARATEKINAKNSVTWQVPPNVTKIRVRSWNEDGSKDMDRVLNVEPNQIFRLDVVTE